ncbi:DUF4291 family protein [Streptomyces sp. CS057]|uniref:DUF4291 family protein n=1 Tax=Streptomyces sp. CS057 TaxID=1982764 RepID=UPI002795986B|nr:DUF4291 family protein [Streptomyces sp. CS057]
MGAGRHLLGQSAQFRPDLPPEGKAPPARVAGGGPVPGGTDDRRPGDDGPGTVHVQWNPERSPRGAALNHYSIQVGIGRHLIRTFTDDWIVNLTDLTPRVRKAATLLQTGHAAKAQRRASKLFHAAEDNYPRGTQGAGGPGTAQCPTVPRTVGHPVARFLRRRRTSRPARPRRTPRRR